MTGERVASEPAAAWCGEMGAPGAKTTNTTTQLILTQQGKLSFSIEA